MKLIESTGQLLEMEKERQVLERRDIQIQRAMLATSVTSVEKLSGITGGSNL